MKNIELSNRIQPKWVFGPIQARKQFNLLEGYYRDMAFVMDKKGELSGFDFYSALAGLCQDMKNVLFPKNRLELYHADSRSFYIMLTKLENVHMETCEWYLATEMNEKAEIEKQMANLCSELKNRFLIVEIV